MVVNPEIETFSRRVLYSLAGLSVLASIPMWLPNFFVNTYGITLSVALVVIPGYFLEHYHLRYKAKNESVRHENDATTIMRLSLERCCVIFFLCAELILVFILLLASQYAQVTMFALLLLTLIILVLHGVLQKKGNEKAVNA